MSGNNIYSEKLASYQYIKQISYQLIREGISQKKINMAIAAIPIDKGSEIPFPKLITALNNCRLLSKDPLFLINSGSNIRPSDYGKSSSASV